MTAGNAAQSIAKVIAGGLVIAGTSVAGYSWYKDDQERLVAAEMARLLREEGKINNTVATSAVAIEPKR